MKPSVLKNFVRDWLAVRTIEPEILHPDVWRFSVPKDLLERLGKRELTLAFTQRAVARDPSAELATVGNPVFDRLLGVAREEGRVGIGYAKPPSAAKRPPSAELVGPIDGIKPEKGEPTYQAIYHMVFTITYPSIETADEIEVVSIDGATLEVLSQTPDLDELWGRLEAEPRKGRSVLPPLPLGKRLVEAGMRALERRMRRRINRVRQTSGQHLEQETASIEVYYQQLIEEARNQSRRWTTRAEEREDRIRWLQLEWKRRVEEANEFWRPQVNARFVGLGIEMAPRVAFRYPVSKGKGRPSLRGPVRLWDQVTGQVLAPYCEGCDRTGLENPRIGPEGGFLCGECAAKAPAEPRKARGGGRKGTERSPGGEGILDQAAGGSLRS